MDERSGAIHLAILERIDRAIREQDAVTIPDRGEVDPQAAGDGQRFVPGGCFNRSILFILGGLCTKVAVLYQDLPYFFCMAAIRSSVVVILLACTVGAANNIKGKISRR